jgi:hypothetical protein
MALAPDREPVLVGHLLGHGDLGAPAAHHEQLLTRLVAGPASRRPSAHDDAALRREAAAADPDAADPAGAGGLDTLPAAGAVGRPGHDDPHVAGDGLVAERIGPGRSENQHGQEAAEDAHASTVPGLDTGRKALDRRRRPA